MKVLVTGGAGFIGSHLTERLLADGHSVTVVDNTSTGKEAHLAHLRTNPRLRFLGGDILNEQLVAAAMTDVELVYHLAAAVGVSRILDNPLMSIVTNVRGTEHVLRRAEDAGARVVFASTSEVYGESEAVPFHEDAQRVLGPTWVHRWGYATSKALDEHLCFAYRDRGLLVSIVRYFNVYGTRLDPSGYGSVVARFLTQALEDAPLTVYGDGTQSRTFTHVRDAVEATVRAGTLDAACGEAFNVGGEREVTINDLAELVRAATGSRSKIVHVPFVEAFGPDFAETHRRIPDIAKARRILSWTPTIALEEGLVELVAERATA